MTLSEVVRTLEHLTESDVLFVRRPWSGESECVVQPLDPGYRVPERLKSAGLVYFLEVPLALEVLEVFGSRPASDAERLRLLLHYAEHDAYPEWAFESNEILPTSR